MAHRPCLLSVHVPSATAGMTSLYDHLRPILGCTQQAGQSYLNSNATIAHEGRPQGGEGTHKGCPYRLSSRGFAPGEGTHKGCPYRLSSLGILPWGGHPQGVPLPIVFSRLCPWGGHPQGAPLPIVFSRHFALGRAPTRGAPTDCFLAAFCPREGTHKGCPYRLSSRGILPWEGHPQGAPLPIVFSRRLALGRVPTRGAPTDCLLAAFCPGKGTHKGCPYRLSSRGVWP